MIEHGIEVLKVIFLGIVEGITEWLPISSTGHMLLVDEFLQMNVSEAFKDMFFVVIQLGAILAVVILFWEKMWPFQRKTPTQPAVRWDTIQMWCKVVVACIPGAVVTILFDDYIEAHLHTPTVIADLGGDHLSDRLFDWPVSGFVHHSGHFPFGIDHHWRTSYRGFPGGGGGIYLLSGCTGDVWLEFAKTAEVWFGVHHPGVGDSGGRQLGGFPGLSGGHQIPHGVH